jgi:hypothetical protein
LERLFTVVRRIAAFLLLATLTLNVTHASGAMETFDFEGPVFIDHGYSVKDHSLVLVDGTYHLFYIRGNAKSFGYATSSDLRRWIIHGTVLAAGPEPFDANQIWAPCVVRYPHHPWRYLMYYTGVNQHIAQRTCLALAMDPSIWHKASTDLFVPFHGDTAWLHWNENEWSNYRDPCFFTEDGVHRLLATAHTRSGLGAVALASSYDFFNWSDGGPLYIHNSWHALESTCLIKHGGLYHLFFTEEQVGGISYMSSDSLAAGWDILKRSIIDGGHAVELTDLGGGRYLFSRHTAYGSPSGIDVATIRFDTLSWNGDKPEVEIVRHLEEDWTILRGDAFEHQPVFGDNPLYRGDDTTSTGFEGNWWIGTYESFDGPLRGRTPGSFQGDGARGAVRSREFTLTGLSMRLLVGGGCYPDSCYVALCQSCSGQIMFKETGRGTDAMDERFWDTSPYRGWSVYLTIVDDCSSPLGHINVDGIEERLCPVPGLPDDNRSERIPIKPDRKMRSDPVSKADDGGSAAGGASIAASPNPFNPRTEIRFETTPNAAAAVAIYSVAGERIRMLDAASGDSGCGSVLWDGRDKSGDTVPAGVYFAVLGAGGRTLAVCKLVLIR